MSSYHQNNDNDDDKQPRPNAPPFRVMSEKQEIADRLNRGERVSQRSSGAIDYNEQSASQPHQPLRGSAATASAASTASTTGMDDLSALSDSAADLMDIIARPPEEGLYSRNSSKNISSSDLSIQKNNTAYRQSARASLNDNSQGSSARSRNLKHHNSITSVTSTASDLSLQKHNAAFRQSGQSERLSLKEEAASQGQSGRSLGAASIIPGMIPLRRNQATATPQDTSSLLEPHQRLVKVQPAAGQRQPGAYMAGSMRRDGPPVASNEDNDGTAPLTTAPLRSDEEQPTGLSQLQSGEMSLTAYGAAGDSIADDTLITDPSAAFDAAAVEGSPVFDDEGGDKKASKRRLYLMIGGVLLLVVIGLGAGLGVAFSGGSSSESTNEATEMNLSPAPTTAPTIAVEQGCNFDTILEECSVSNIFTTLEVPACLQDRYEELRQDVVPNVLGLDSVPDTQSCEPDNLALLSMALHTTNETTDEALSIRFGLSTFYFATGGADWYTNTNWISDANPCTWYQVGCLYTAKPDSVTHLNFDGNNLKGTLPSSWLRHLPDFAVCVLSKNVLSGTVSPEFASLDQLWIGENKLDGTFPFQAFADSTQMNSLDIGSNNFAQMTLPLSFAGTQWQALHFGNSNFAPGPFPIQLLSLPRMVSLRLGKTNIVGTIPSAIGTLGLLQDLKLEDNALFGTIPTQMGNLAKLEQSLTIERNELTGTLPSELGKLTKLDTFKLYFNKLTGTMPTELGNLESLSIFVFENNLFDGVVPDELCELKAQGQFDNFGSQDPFSCADNFGGLTCPTKECCNC